MFEFSGNRNEEAQQGSQQVQEELTPFQQEMLPVRNALIEGKKVTAQSALEKINSCDLDGVEAELNKDKNSFFWYSTSIEDLPGTDLKRFSVHKIGKASGMTPVMSTLFAPCEK